jgi:ornithine cyclodeaminase/alanine dehydrogenase-like protein (mu-crystallin family)
MPPVSDSVLLLDNDEIEKVLDVNTCLAALERAYLAIAHGNTAERGRSQIRVPLDQANESYNLKSMEGAICGDGYMTLRLTSDVIFEGKVDGKMRREKLPRGPGGTYCGLILVFSTATGAPVAILQDGLIQLVRVACTSALATRILAREDASELGLIGSGDQAWWHLVTMNTVRALRRVRVFSPSAERRAAFAARARRELGIEAVAVSTAHEAIKEADIVVTATNASEPVLDGAWIAEGAHVVSIVSGDKGSVRRELDDVTMQRAALVVAHSKAGAIEHGNGDLAAPVAAGILSWEKVVDFSDLVGGNAPRRARRDDITVFKNNGGVGMQFAAVAPGVYELARERGIGRQLPVAWFVEKMKS